MSKCHFSHAKCHFSATTFVQDTCRAALRDHDSAVRISDKAAAPHAKYMAMAARSNSSMTASVNKPAPSQPLLSS